MVCAEGTHHTHLGSSAQAIATIHNLGIDLVRLARHQKIKAIPQYIAADLTRLPSLHPVQLAFYSYTQS